MLIYNVSPEDNIFTQIFNDTKFMNNVSTKQRNRDGIDATDLKCVTQGRMEVQVLGWKLRRTRVQRNLSKDRVGNTTNIGSTVIQRFGSTICN